MIMLEVAVLVSWSRTFFGNGNSRTFSLDVLVTKPYLFKNGRGIGKSKLINVEINQAKLAVTLGVSKVICCWQSV